VGQGEKSVKGFVFIFLVLVLWEAFSRLTADYARYFLPVSVILSTLVQLFVSGEIPNHIVTSVTRILRGYMLGIVFGLTLGTVAGMWRPVYDLLEPVVELLRPLPSVVLLPLVILLVGIGDGMNVTMIAYGTTWPIFINTLEGVRSVDPVHENTGRVFGLNRLELIRKVMIPSALPYIVSGLRIALGIAVIVVISTEMIGSGRGLGFFLIDASMSIRIPDMYAALLIIALLGYGFNEAFRALERVCMAWHRGLTFKEQVF
jgi:NitT/TauT family transport system permease protein/sulfonate transport system permease protein